MRPQNSPPTMPTMPYAAMRTSDEVEQVAREPVATRAADAHRDVDEDRADRGDEPAVAAPVHRADEHDEQQDLRDELLEHRALAQGRDAPWPVLRRRRPTSNASASNREYFNPCLLVGGSRFRVSDGYGHVTSPGERVVVERRPRIGRAPVDVLPLRHVRGELGQ